MALWSASPSKMLGSTFIILFFKDLFILREREGLSSWLHTEGGVPHGAGSHHHETPKPKSQKQEPGTMGTLTADGVGAAGTLLGIQVAEAAQAVGELLPGREALARQRLLAGSAHEALPVPRLLAVRDAAGGDGLQEARGPR